MGMGQISVTWMHEHSWIAATGARSSSPPGARPVSSRTARTPRYQARMLRLGWSEVDHHRHAGTDALAPGDCLLGSRADVHDRTPGFDEDRVLVGTESGDHRLPVGDQPSSRLATSVITADGGSRASTSSRCVKKYCRFGRSVCRS